MVLLYDKTPEEVWLLNKHEIERRLYKLVGLNSFATKTSNYGRLSLVHHQEARPSSEIKLKNGSFQAGENFRPGILLLHTQFNALIAGVDFEINDLGEITRLK